ncbi:MAG TPA: hypothetical protein VGQ00_02175 [Candidatus Norongarragalinales archaeon]|jgi:phosphoenolpyruvate-protein kinase (PTS system EI component)|nr:hypothetical protein [Candidatus Norongarragalinales archaeon]
MVNVQDIIQNMRRRGMTDAQIKQNLKELGVADVESFFEQATSALKEVRMMPEDENIKPIPFTRIVGDEEKSEGATAEERPQVVTRVSKIDTEELGNRMEEILALMKAMQQVNKQILDTNRDILMRLKMRE